MMPYVDLSFEGRQLAERNQLDNGRLPHGGYRGSKKFPPSLLSCEKGVEFQHSLVQEVQQILRDEAIYKCGPTPTWSLLVHKEPAYTDESPLMTNDFLAANKIDQSNGGGPYTRGLTSPTKCAPPVRNDGVLYYRPNRMHQYLSATELRNSAQTAVNIQHGRPTRTTLLRARNRSVSAPVTIGRDYHQRLEEIRHSYSTHSHQISGSPLHTQYFQLQTSPGDESFYSFLTGARYNRAHCLDSKSVDHSGVYMPRHNPAFGCFYRGPKGQWYLQELEDSLNDSPVNSPNRSHHQQPRPTSAPIHPRASTTSHDVGTPTPTEESLAPQGTAGPKMAASPRASNAKVKVSPRAGHTRRSRNRANLSFNIVGQRVPISGVKLPVLGKVKETPPETETLTPQPAQEVTSRVTSGGRQGSATSDRLEISVLIEEEQDDKVEDDKVEDDKVEDDKVEDDKVEDDKVEDDKVEDDKVEDDKVEDDKVEDDKVEDDKVEDDKVEDDKVEDDKVEDDKVEDDKIEDDKIEDDKVEEEKNDKADEEDERLDGEVTEEFEDETMEGGRKDRKKTEEAPEEGGSQPSVTGDIQTDELDQVIKYDDDETDLELDQQGTNEADLELDQQGTNEDDMEQIHQRLADEDNLDKKADEKVPENDKSDENAASQEDVLFFVTEKDGVQEPVGELKPDSGEQQ